ncbi:MAG: hypothetical protein M3115_07240 [Thermoproteota archaeon]|nr:hypothetical protein [Thermoproteota archaeon]
MQLQNYQSYSGFDTCGLPLEKQAKVVAAVVVVTEKERYRLWLASSADRRNIVT